jgi:hypothetical protein
MADCSTCKHNTYAGRPAISDWVDCSHPVTIAKTPKPEKGDPEWVNFMTADRRVPEMANMMEGRSCAAWEAQP